MKKIFKLKKTKNKFNKAINFRFKLQIIKNKK